MAQDVFREVEDDLKAERVRKIARRYAGAGIVVAVFAVAAGVAWSWRVSGKNADLLLKTGIYLSALRQTDHISPSSAGPVALPETAQAGLISLRKLATTSPEGIKTLARLQEGGVQAAQGDIKAALTTWDLVQNDERADPLLRSLASLLWCQRQVDEGDPAMLRSRLSLLSGKDKPWSALASESLAILDLREGKVDAARKKFAALAEDQAIPSGVRSRAQAMLEVIEAPAG